MTAPVLIGDAPRSKITGFPGWHTDAEAEMLMELASDVRDGGTVVCVGVEYGRCVSEIAAATAGRDVKIYAVDLFPSTHHLGNLFDIFRSNILEAGLQGRVTMIEGDSAEMGNSWQHGEIDLLFIDAGHHYDQVKKDILAWTPHVRDGAPIIFHDYAKNVNSHAQHFEVKQAVDEKYGDVVLDGPDSMVYVYQGSEVFIPADFTQLTGIGDVVQDKLYAMEIHTFEELVKADTEEIIRGLDMPRVNTKMVTAWKSEALDYL